jgi:hypothetical protein
MANVHSSRSVLFPFALVLLCTALTAEHPRSTVEAVAHSSLRVTIT